MYTLKTGERNFLQEIMNYEHSVGLNPKGYEYELIQGRGRYNKVVASCAGSRRAVAFIDKQTSHIFVAGSWSKPAKTRIT